MKEGKDRKDGIDNKQWKERTDDGRMMMERMPGNEEERKERRRENEGRKGREGGRKEERSGRHNYECVCVR